MKNREDFSELNEQELEEKYKHYKEELFNLRFQAVTGQLSNPSRISIVRRNIARVKTYLTRLEKVKIAQLLKAEYDALLKEEKIDSLKTPLSEKISKLKARLSLKARKVNQEIKNNCDKKVAELLKSMRGEVSKKLRDAKGSEDAQLKAASKKLRDPKCTIRKKFLDKLSEMGLNDASQIATLKESKRAKLRELENIRVLQRELTAGRLPF
ncbi:MAG: 50S ribosomal protein L29 [bacterium ADurb.Bin157]|jgi:large subunit ribosomal protein L29|nr:50S ribosomal protein L29 [Candidatus Riflebacteria bacterium]OQB50856.1 MAG: 50S ribosomal protein L29 [bacterium ADurb.Bin157]